MAKKISLRTEVLSDLKKKLEIHNKGKYLSEPNKEELEEREVEKELRKKELEEVEKVIRDKQVKFLATRKELDEIKKSALLDNKSLSEFIRSAIWEKIGSVELRDIIPFQISSIEAEDLKEDLKYFKERLKKISKLERTILSRISRLEMQENDIKGELVEIKKRLAKLEIKEKD